MTDNDPLVPHSNSGPSWRFVVAAVVGSLVVHMLVATGIYFGGRFPGLPGDGEPATEVELVQPDQLPAPPKALEPAKPEAKIEPPKPPPEPEKPQPQPPKPPEPEKPKQPPVKADPSQVVIATRDKATPPQGNQAAPTTAKRESENPDKPDTQSADKAKPSPDQDQPKPDPDQPKADAAKPDEPKQADVKPEEPKPADPNGILPKQEPPKPEPPKQEPTKAQPAKPTPQKQAAVQASNPPPSKQAGGASHRVMAPLTVRPDRFNGRAGNSGEPSYPSTARANGLQGRVILDVLLTPEGNIRRVNIIKSSGYDELDESAVRAAWLWRFQPIGVHTQEDWIEVPIDFRLN